MAFAHFTRRSQYLVARTQLANQSLAFKIGRGWYRLPLLHSLRRPVASTLQTAVSTVYPDVMSLRRHIRL